MGAIAEAFVAYAQPLLDQTDGSEGQLNKAFAISQLCYNLAPMPEDSRDQTLSEIKLSLEEAQALVVAAAGAGQVAIRPGLDGRLHPPAQLSGTPGRRCCASPCVGSVPNRHDERADWLILIPMLCGMAAQPEFDAGSGRVRSDGDRIAST